MGLTVVKWGEGIGVSCGEAKGGHPLGWPPVAARVSVRTRGCMRGKRDALLSSQPPSATRSDR